MELSLFFKSVIMYFRRNFHCHSLFRELFSRFCTFRFHIQALFIRLVLQYSSDSSIYSSMLQFHVFHMQVFPYDDPYLQNNISRFLNVRNSSSTFLPKATIINII
ncbi:hypothetical protein F8M41_010209 [Gigaspora margarita]|uniref:Uncharacterized protein n=1 Tax=Gigaspora margarita TaxID=4874 RepID=A0A8H4A2I3_GIGMA|nr:hypothetical protein F8M41_010209 [Gigaspora margarita]